MKTRYTGEVSIGDLVLVHCNGGMEAGFYVGQGKSGTFQYYTLVALENYYYRDPLEKDKRKPWKSYINSPNKWSIAKLHVDNLDAEHKELYDKSIEVLKLLKIK